MCGIVGTFNVPKAANFTYLAEYRLQHRGQQACGIATYDDGFLLEKELGSVGQVFDQDRLNRLPGLTALGQNRYGTSGINTKAEAQPFVVHCQHGDLAVVHNGNFPFAFQNRDRLERSGAIFSSTSDTEVLLHQIASTKASKVEEAIARVLNKVVGAFSLIFLTPTALIAIRDPHGFRPLSLARKGEGYIVASETCAFDLIEATFVRDIERGEMVVIDRFGVHSSRPFKETRSALCPFEHVYFARPDSVVYGKNVTESREDMGRYLAQEHPVDADVVVPVLN